MIKTLLARYVVFAVCFLTFFLTLPFLSSETAL